MPEDRKNKKSIGFFSRSLFLAPFEEHFSQFILILIMYICVYFCVCISEGKYLRRTEGVVTPGTIVTGCYKLHDMGAGTKLETSGSKLPWLLSHLSSPKAHKSTLKICVQQSSQTKTTLKLGLNLTDVFANLYNLLCFSLKKRQVCHFLLWSQMWGDHEGGGRKLKKNKSRKWINGIGQRQFSRSLYWISWGQQDRLMINCSDQALPGLQLFPLFVLISEAVSLFPLFPLHFPSQIFGFSNAHWLRTQGVKLSLVSQSLRRDGLWRMQSIIQTKWFSSPP